MAEQVEREPGRQTRSRFAAPIAALLLALLAFALYLPTGEHGFTQDDHLLIGGSEALRSTEGWARLFVTDFFSRTTEGGSDIQVGYFRPMPRLSWMLTYAAAGLTPGAFHLVSAALHGLTAGLLLLLLDALGAGLLAAIAGAAIFAAHPAHAEAVQIVTAQSDVLAALFAVLAWLALVRGGASAGWKRPAWAALTFAATLAAALSKEVGLAVAPVALLLAWWGSEQVGLARLRSMAWRLAPVAAATALYFAMRMQALHGLAATGQHRAYGAFAYLFGLPVVLVDYLGLQFWPLGTAYLYPPIRVPESLPLSWWLSVAVLVGLAYALVRLVQARAWLAVTGLVLLVVGQLPSMAFHLVRVPGGETALPFASRWLYLPSLGLGLVAAEVMGWLVARPRLRLGSGAVAAAMLIMLAALTTIRLPLFASDLTLMQAAVNDMATWESSDLPPDAKYYALTTAGLAAMEQGRVDEAVGFLEAALADGPSNIRALVNLSNAELRRGNFAKVVTLMDRGLAQQFYRDRDDLFMLRGLARLRLRQFAEAAGDFREAIRFNAAVADGYLLLAESEQGAGARERAIAALEQGLGVMPGEPRLLFNLGMSAGADCAKAAPAMQRYLQVDPAGDPRRRTMAEATMARCAQGAGR